MRRKLLIYSARIPAIMLATVLVGAMFQLRTCDASYSCCSEERRGTVCTLAGSGTGATTDSPNPTAAAFNGPFGVALYPPHRIIVVGHDECRLRLIHHNGTVSTLAGGGSVGSYVDSDDPLAARFNLPAAACTDSEGKVLLCDYYNQRIRTILRNGSVRTLAGSGNAGYADNADPLKHAVPISPIITRRARNVHEGVLQMTGDIR